MELTFRELARILHTEFERYEWGAIDPWLFKAIADGAPDDDEDDQDVLGMEEVLQHVVQSIQHHLRGEDWYPPDVPD